MEKTLNPKVAEQQKKRIDKFWFQLFEKLDTLSKLQLIVCPDSITHQNESKVTVEHYETLKRMYELLSHGTSFDHFDTIQRFQFIISVDASNIEEDVRLLKAKKQISQGQMNQLFKNWQQQKDFDFEKHWDLELSSYGNIIKKLYLQYIENFAKVQFGLSANMDKLMDTRILTTVHSLKEIFSETGLDEEEALIKVGEFLSSPSLRNVPFLKISTLLFTALARKAATGQKRIPNASFFDDVKTISALMPYCDAMFIDNECASLLREEPLKSRISYQTKVFSVNTKEEFLEYLDEIENGTPKAHFDKVKEVYGETWHKPYNTLYMND